MEGDHWDANVASPQHDHQSDEEFGEGRDLPRRPPVQELAYHSDSGYRGSQELHHRANRHAARSQNRAANGGGSRYTTNSTNAKAAKLNAIKRRRWMVMRVVGFLGVVTYFVIMIQGSSVLHDLDEEQRGTQLPPFDRRGMRATRLLLDKKRVEDRRKAAAESEKRASERLLYTRPPQTAGQIDREYIISSMEEQPRPSHRQVDLTPARLEDICGSHARNASLAYPNSYLSKDALNSKSRVMITGILNPIGFHLALALKERCGVQIMTGIDPMFPNTVAHRLELQKRIELLTTNIPKLVQPIVLPLVGLDPRLNKNQKNEPSLLPTTGELSLLNFRPTHIVHLASYSPDEYMDPAHPEYWNLQSPYVTEDRSPPLYRIRSSLASMEQVLASIVSADDDEDTQRPHLTYASSSHHPDPVHLHLKLADELLADTYSSLHGAYSVGMRLPNAVYGPWGRPGTPMYQMADAAVASWNRTIDSTQLLTSAGLENAADRVEDLLYVSDAVDAIIAAMQFRSESQAPVIFEASAESQVRLSSAATAVVKFMRPGSDSSLSSVPPVENAMMQRTRTFLKWKPETSLRTGMMKLLAWHLDKENRFGLNDSKSVAIDSHTAAGDAFLLQHGAETCAADDVLCHSGKKVLPCASECATKANCIPSVFDDVADLTKEVTEQCDVILYTQSLGYNVQDLKLKVMYSEEGTQIVCNYAFVPRDSKLVDSVIKKVPNEQLVKFGVNMMASEKSGEVRQRKLDGLNGRLLYKGWILIWVKDSTTKLSTFDDYLLKLNPGKFFSKDVKHALYVHEHFPVSPNIEDVLFLMGETHRPALGGRSVYRKDEDGKKHKYKLQPEPERRAVVLLAPLKQRASSNSKETALADGQKLTVYTATKFMRFEIGEDATQKEAPSRKMQREFYERIPTFVNRNDMRSPDEPWYRFELKHWIRTRWIVHDLQLQEGRDLRCDWYEEHVQWGNDLDQLSFAYVMARLEVERRIAHQELDDHVKPPHVEHPELKLLTDAHEWYAYSGKEHRLDSLGKALVEVPEHMTSKDDKEEGDIETEPVIDEIHGTTVPLFVRIMSERVMMFARHKWAEAHGKAIVRRKKHKPQSK